MEFPSTGDYEKWSPSSFGYTSARSSDNEAVSTRSTSRSFFFFSDTNSTIGSTATGSNFTGAGRALGNIYSALGTKLERALGQFAHKSGHGPRATSERILRRMNEYTLLYDQILYRRYSPITFDCVPYFETGLERIDVSKRKVENSCRRLLQYLTSEQYSIRFNALACIITVSLERSELVPYFRTVGAIQTLECFRNSCLSQKYLTTTSADHNALLAAINRAIAIVSESVSEPRADDTSQQARGSTTKLLDDGGPLLASQTVWSRFVYYRKWHKHDDPTTADATDEQSERTGILNACKHLQNYLLLESSPDQLITLNSIISLATTFPGLHVYFQCAGTLPSLVYLRHKCIQALNLIQSDSSTTGEHFSKLIWTTVRAITSLVDCELNSLAKRLLDFEMEGTSNVDILHCERRLEDMSRDPKLSGTHSGFLAGAYLEKWSAIKKGVELQLDGVDEALPQLYPTGAPFKPLDRRVIVDRLKSVCEGASSRE